MKVTFHVGETHSAGALGYALRIMVYVAAVLTCMSASGQNIRYRASGSSDSIPDCPQPPTSVSGNYQYSYSLMSFAAALRLGLPIFSGSGSYNSMVLVRDYMRFATCTASDGKTQVLYGQTIRTVITILDYDAKLGSSFAAVAADATLNNKKHAATVMVRGIENPRINGIIGEFADKEFNVESYGEFSKVEKELILLLDDHDTKTSIEKIGVLAPLDVGVFDTASAVAYALSQIAKQQNCQKARIGFPDQTSEPALSAISGTYESIVGDCSGTSPTTAQRDKAKQYLHGVHTALFQSRQRTAPLNAKPQIP